MSCQWPILQVATGVVSALVLKGNLGDKPHCPLQVPILVCGRRVREDFSERMILDWF